MDPRLRPCGPWSRPGRFRGRTSPQLVARPGRGGTGRCRFNRTAVDSIDSIQHRIDSADVTQPKCAFYFSGDPRLNGHLDHILPRTLHALHTLSPLHPWDHSGRCGIWKLQAVPWQALTAVECLFGHEDVPEQQPSEGGFPNTADANTPELRRSAEEESWT